MKSLSSGVLAAAMTSVGCVDALVSCPDAFYELITPEPQVRLPRDETAHCFGGVEWWYYSGRLKTTDDQSFGIVAVIFHVPRRPYARLTERWIAHYAVMDGASGEFAYDQAISIWPHPPMDCLTCDFDLTTDIVRASGVGGEHHLNAGFADGRFDLSLTLTDRKGPALHSGDGYVPYGSGLMSFYYSRPRMAADGTLLIDGEAVAVTGELWFDRQWGLSLNDPLQPWEWFSIRLDDGCDIMLFVFPDRNGGEIAFGTIVDSDARPRPLAAADFMIEATDSWTSPHTGICYATRWGITIVSDDLSLDVSAVAPDQELDTRATTLNIYWEGLCTVTGTRGDEGVGGYAYVEQVNAGAQPKSPTSLGRGLASK